MDRPQICVNNNPNVQDDHRDYVFAAWRLCRISGGFRDALNLALARSTDGGVEWVTQRIDTVGAGDALHVRGMWDSGLSDDLKFPNRDHADYTSMAVDTTTGCISVVWTNHGDPMLDLPKESLGWMAPTST